MRNHTHAPVENSRQQVTQSANLRVPSNSTHPVNRLEVAWAWASLLVLIICWDAALRLDQRVPVPRVRIAHAAEERPAQTRELAEL